MSSTAPPAPECFRIGATAGFEQRIDAATVDAFAQLSGDFNPLHMDADYATRTPFGERIAHGMICGALFSRLVGEHLPGERALYRSQQVQFVKPIPIGTWVVVRGEVTGFDEELSRMKIHTTVRGRDDDALLVEGEAEVILRPPPPEPEPTETVDERGCGPLDRRRVLVVGGSRGIGAAICDELIAQGADLSVSYCRNESAARAIGDRAAAAGRRGLAVPLVLEEEASIASAVERSVDALQGLDALVFCGFGEIVQRGLERGTFEQLEDAFRRAVGGLYHCSRAALPALRQSDDGAIVALSSTVTLEVPPPCWTAYNVAKSALVGLARSLAVELGPDGVRVNLVSPSLTETEKNAGLPPRILDELRSRSVLGRLATPRDVARAVAFLASDRASFLTGVDLPVAGGAVM